MEVYGSGQRSYGYGGDRRVEIVSGRSLGPPGNQIYGSRPPRSPDPPRETRPSQSASKPWGGFSDPETQRRRRLAKYKVYTVEGKVKASLRKGIQWVKNKCSQIIHGY